MNSDDQRAALRRHKLFAAMALLCAAALWLLTHVFSLPPVLAGYIRSAAEAGMVGGFADWFAVTALFRRPLGLPIPHTNLIQENQGRIAEGVARYIDGEFLRREMLVDQLRRFDIAGRIGRLLGEPEARRRLVDGMMRVLPRLLDSRSDAAIGEALAKALYAGMRDLDLRPTVARLVASIIEGDDVQILIRDACDYLRDQIELRRRDLLALVSERTPWFLPAAVDRRIAEILIGGFSSLLENLKDPESEKGRELRQWLRGIPASIEHSDVAKERFFELMQKWANDREIANIAATLWTEAKRLLLEDVKAPESKTRAVLDEIAASLAAQLDGVPLRRQMNAAVEALLAENVPAWREQIRHFIVETLANQHPKQFAGRIELQVGKDLQFIRINGTVIGALVGAALHCANGLF
jgi:uncharacterized membrane-anchored protein YjiN (DUF445 family)